MSVPTITGRTRVIAHLGVPTHTFRSPAIYNAWFAASGTDVVVAPIGVEAADLAAFLPALLRSRNVLGALVTMPHKVTTVALLDRASDAVRLCGACNAVRRDADGRLVGEMFDGEGFMRAMRTVGRDPGGASALVVGAGGVGSAIAAALALGGVRRLVLHDARADAAERLAARLRAGVADTSVAAGPADPAGHDVVVNATPLGMDRADPLPLDPTRLDPGALVGDVVLAAGDTPLVEATRVRGCTTIAGLDVLFEQIPAYLDFFGLPAADAATLRAIAPMN